MLLILVPIFVCDRDATVTKKLRKMNASKNKVKPGIKFAYKGRVYLIREILANNLVDSQDVMTKMYVKLDRSIVETGIINYIKNF